MPSAIVKSKQEVNKLLNWIDGNVCKALDGGPVEVVLKRPEANRTFPQNSKFHSMISDIHKYAVIKIPGRRIVMRDFDYDAAKALLVVWFANERQDEGRPLKKPPRTVVCPMTGERITVRPSTVDDFTKSDTVEFIEWLYALGTINDVKWSEPALKEYETYREASRG